MEKQISFFEEGCFLCPQLTEHTQRSPEYRSGFLDPELPSQPKPINLSVTRLACQKTMAYFATYVRGSIWESGKERAGFLIYT